MEHSGTESLDRFFATANERVDLVSLGTEGKMECCFREEERTCNFRILLMHFKMSLLILYASVSS